MTDFEAPFIIVTNAALVPRAVWDDGLGGEILAHFFLWYAFTTLRGEEIYRAQRAVFLRHLFESWPS